MDESSALISQATWELVPPLANANVVSCRCVLTIEYRTGRSIDQYKVCLVAKGFTQAYSVTVFETFSPDACLNLVCVLFSFVVNHDWLCIRWL